MRFSSISVVSVLSSLALLGCVEDEGAPEGDLLNDQIVDGEAVKLGSTEQAVVWGGSTSTCNGGACYFDYGATAGRTCYLGGIWGSLREASASIFTYADGRYKLRLGVPAGRSLSATVICIGTSANKAEGFWTGGQAADLIGGINSATRRCFLTQVDNNVTNLGFDNTSDYVRVWKSGSSWYMGGSLAGGSNLRGAAVCVDVPADYGTWGIVSGAGAGNTVSFDLAEDTGGVACGLTKLGGNFTTNSLSDGLGVSYNAGSLMWNITAVNGKQATAICVR